MIFLLYGSWGDPWGGWAYGPRYLVPAFAQCAILIGVAIANFGRQLWFALLFILSAAYGIMVNLSGALATNQIPTSHEAEYAGVTKPIFLHELQVLQQGMTSSFAYQTYFYKYLSLDHYWLLIYCLVLLLILSLYLIFLKSPDKSNHFVS